MELRRSVQGSRWHSLVAILTVVPCLLVIAVSNGCNEKSAMPSTVHHSNTKRTIIAVADNVEIDSTTAILHNPSIFPLQTEVDSVDKAALASKWGIVAHDPTLASSITIAFPVSLSSEVSDSQKRLLLAMMPPIWLGAPSRLEIIKFSADGQIENTKTVTIDMLTCVATEAQQGGQPERR